MTDEGSSVLWEELEIYGKKSGKVKKIVQGGRHNCMVVFENDTGMWVPRQVAEAVEKMGGAGTIITIKREKSSSEWGNKKFSVQTGELTWIMKDEAWDIFLRIVSPLGTIFNLVVWALLAYGAYWIIKAIIGFIKYYSHFA